MVYLLCIGDEIVMTDLDSLWIACSPARIVDDDSCVLSFFLGGDLSPTP